VYCVYPSMSDLQAVQHLDRLYNPVQLTDEEWSWIVEHEGEVLGITLTDKTTKRLNGFVMVRHYPHSLEILTLVVIPKQRRYGLGSAMVKGIQNVGTKRNVSVTLTVPDAEIGVHAFLKSLGFRCIRVIQDRYESGDGYLFSWRPPKGKPNAPVE